MTIIIFIFIGQFSHAVLRTAAVQAIARNKKWSTICLNAVANLVRLLVLSNGVIAVVGGNWLAVFAVISGQAVGDFISMHYGSKVIDA